MKQRVYLLFFPLLVACANPDIKTEDHITSDTGTLSPQFKPTIEYTLQTTGDTTNNFYVTVFPKKEIRGVLILLSGFGELPTETLVDSDIYKYASRSGYITFIPALGDRLFFYCDTTSQKKLANFIDSVFREHKLETNNFFIGGYSLGGFAAFQYAEKAYAPGSTLRKPRGVFGADPPLDLEMIYNSMTSTDRPPKHPGVAQGERLFTDLVEKVFKTNPRKNPTYFWDISVFSFSDPSHNAIKPLVQVPLRVYHDPDINWYIENRRVDYSDLNVVHGAAMVNWLRSMGNKNAELINSLGKGYKRGVRAPHSWSIIDGKELLNWMKTMAR